MLQFSAILYSATARLTPHSSWRFTALVANNLSTAITNEQPAVPIKENENTQALKHSEIQKNILQKEEQSMVEKKVSQMNINLSEINKNDNFTKHLQAATSVNDLLNMVMLPNISVSDALKLISRITNAINSGKSQVENIETDHRFIYLRKMVKDNSQTKTKIISNDLLQYSQLSTPTMINMIASLGEKGQRNTPLLRMLSHNIVKYNMKLNLNQCSTLLYSMAVLNFPDKLLLEKIMADLLYQIPKSKHPVTNKSIITSLGFLRYKNEDVLDMFCETIFNKSIRYKLEDYSSILQTFAVLQYKSSKANDFIKDFAQQVNSPYISPMEWLNIVWSLTVLGFAQQQHVNSVLEPLFVPKLSTSTILSVSKKLKLLNINAFAQFGLKYYKGPFLSEDSVVFKDVSLIRSKEKQAYINALSEALKQLFPSPLYFEIDVNTNMGFLLDAEFHIDDQHNPISKENWNKSKNMRRLGIMVHDYHDFCRGQNDLLGVAYLQTQLLKAQGYDLIKISYENFSMQDKVEKRINYLKQCMSNVLKKRST